ncbi:MAG: aminopeptidase, partial [Deltaproteobacteria bacterium]|nr:aminopeptidase [Deltaproteobacteria bacterium]
MAATFKRFVGACLLLLLCGCSPGYYIRAAYEEGRILWRRTPITTVLAEDGVTPEVRRKLEMVLELRDYAATDLRLNVGGSYTSYSRVDRPVLLHVLSAVPKTSFEPYTWWFPFVGRMPYKGFFDGADAREEAGSLAAQGYDTHIRPAGAFSTLGWFDDPLLGRLLKLDRVSLADVVLHELLHNTLFVPGSVAFNESLANFVGKRGAIEFFTRRFGPESPGARAAPPDWREEIE